MNIIINHSSMIPIYQQIVEEIKSLILRGELKENDPLPSVRSLSKELKISALTVKKAYDFLEEEGFSKTIHGKGSFISQESIYLLNERKQMEVEAAFSSVVEKAKSYGMTEEEIKEIFFLILGGNYD
ncbi:GntR family transcriptional regulator [Peptoniphilus sp. KCTC 25270]|uniref:GntR family transcriptional regulator n=1 Tax=Peptoniphilus sp. KCTC 25270 TaxID=2897414 RepID=UPI001E3DCE1E|nr:GntR family transcriptional regulator [Peptoniphilus sp. KCTC 25270]MCD1147543.1 GntR family transcriptional regulator [Peptoniphilus sp. KCTC 25270]